MRWGSGLIFAATVSAAAVLPAAAADQDAMLKRGAYLINGPVACGNCHNARAKDMSFIPGKEFSGGFHIVDPAFDVYAANITPDKETGIGSWTDAEIIKTIREGKNKEGKIIFPPMPVPTYNSMSDDDVKAIVAFLHTIKPVHNEVPESKYKIPQQAMPPAKGAPAPATTDKVAYGGYIVNSLAHCFECHSGPDEHGAPDMAHKLGAGGFEIMLAPGMTVHDRQHHVRSRDGHRQVERRRHQEGDDGRASTPRAGISSPPMPFPFFKNMTDEDLDAVVAYLRTIPPIKNKVERTDFQKKAFP